MAKPSEGPRFELMPLQELLDRRHPDNAKDHDLGLIVESIKKHGLGRKPSINEVDGKLLYGHGTSEALALMMESGDDPPDQIVAENGDWLVPVERGKRLPKKLAASYRLVDNKATEDGGWLEPELLDVLTSLDDLSGTGFDRDDVDRLFQLLNPDLEDVSISDEAEKLQRKWKTKTGQLWEVGRHRLLCGDATDGEDVERLLGGAAPNLMVTDPPYGVEYDPDWRNRGVQEGWLKFADGSPGFAPTRTEKITNDDRSDWSDAYKLFVGNVIYAWSPQGGYIIVTGWALEAAGFEIRSQVIWVKPHFPLSRGHYTYRHEPCWYAVRQGKGANWIGPKNADSVWRTPLDRDVEGSHPTQKPVECMARPIQNHSGDVYDPFIGSGTTMVAAEQLNRTCYGMEIEPRYCGVVLERMSKMGLEPRLIEDDAKG